MKYISTRAAMALILTLLVGAGATVGASAEGPGIGGRRIRLEDELAGPYRIRVVTSPTPPTVDNLYLEIRIADASSGDLVTEATVITSAQPVDAEGEGLIAEATHDIAPIPTEFASHLPVPSPGVWQIDIEIQGPLGPARVGFQERISAPTSVGAVLSVGVPIAGLLVLGLVFFWLERNSGESAS